MAEQRDGEARHSDGDDISYGVDRWPLLAALGLVAAVAGVGAIVVLVLAPGGYRWLALVIAVVAVLAAVPALLGLRYATRGKLELRDRVLAAVPWSGSETVADLGAGLGLLGIGAAQRTRGDVYCIDLWVDTALSGNSPDGLRRNAEAEGVADRVHVKRANLCSTALSDASVDVVMSSLTLHAVGREGPLRAAITEIARILRPGGRIVIADLAQAEREYEPYFREAGFQVLSSERVEGVFPPQRLLVATAPA